MKGRAGAYSFYSSKGRQVVRVSQNSSNYGESARRSIAQQRRRVMWANLVNFYKGSASWIRGAFETKKSNETDYNAFMRKNLPMARIPLTKDEAAVGSCVVDGYMISEGTLDSKFSSWDGTTFTTKIKVSKAFSASDLVSDLSSDIFANNPDMHEGMQLSFIEFRQSVTGGYPKMAVYKFEITLSASDTRPIGSFIPNVVISKKSDGSMQVEPVFKIGSAAAMIVSESTNGRIRVSTENVHIVSETTIRQYTNQEQLDEAMESYGVDPAYFLESGSDQVSPVAPAQRILSALVNNKYVKDGMALTFAEDEGLTSLRLTFALDVAGFDSIDIYAGGGHISWDESYWDIDSNTLVLRQSGLEEFVDEYGENVIPFKAVAIIGDDLYTIEWTVVRT